MDWHYARLVELITVLTRVFGYKHGRYDIDLTRLRFLLYREVDRVGYVGDSWSGMGIPPHSYHRDVVNFDVGIHFRSRNRKQDPLVELVAIGGDLVVDRKSCDLLKG